MQVFSVMQVLSYSKEMNRNVTTKVNFVYKLKKINAKEMEEISRESPRLRRK